MQRGLCELCNCCQFLVYDADIQYKCKCGHGEVWHRRIYPTPIKAKPPNKLKKLISPILKLFNRKQTSQTECPICLDNITTLVVLNCGHPFCYECSKNIHTTCPICRTYITNKIKVYT